MPLDSNLFVLLVRPRPAEPGWVDLIVDGSPSEEVLYSAHKDSSTSVLTLYDPLTSTSYGKLYQTPPSLPNATTPNPRLRTIALDSPPLATVLRNSKGISWEWKFEWEEVEYVWARDVVGLLGSERGFTLSVSRKPDPNYPVVIFHPKKKGGSIEILDYNFARVEPTIQDKKGLEVTFLLALCFFLDNLFPSTPSASAAIPSASSPSEADQTRPDASPEPASDVPRPPQAVRRRSPPPVVPRKRSYLATNELEVTSSSRDAVAAYCSRCLALLDDPLLMYIVLSPSEPNLAGTVVQLAEEVKRKRYKSSGEEVRLFVDDGEDEDEPPRDLKIYLSRLELGELLPTHRRSTGTTTPARQANPRIRPAIDFDRPPPVPARPEPVPGAAPSAVAPGPGRTTTDDAQRGNVQGSGEAESALTSRWSSWFGRT
ncbi:hypothetical protein JCM10212_005057 [Sporobolomyces blumeae]